MSQGLDSTADRGVDDTPLERGLGARWKDVQGSHRRDGQNDDRQRECGQTAPARCGNHERTTHDEGFRPWSADRSTFDHAGGGLPRTPAPRGSDTLSTSPPARSRPD